MLCIITSCYGQRNLLLFGDSLSTGYGIPQEDSWVRLLEQQLEQQAACYKVINKSIAGETAAFGKQRLPKLLDTYQPELVLIELGGNDGLRGLPLDSIKANLQALINLSKQNNSQVMLLGILMPPNYGEAYTKEFAAIYKDLSEAEQIAFVPFLLEGVADVREYMQADQIHPNSKAQAIIFTTVWNKLQPLLAPCK